MFTRFPSCRTITAHSWLVVWLVGIPFSGCHPIQIRIDTREQTAECSLGNMCGFPRGKKERNTMRSLRYPVSRAMSLPAQSSGSIQVECVSIHVQPDQHSSIHPPTDLVPQTRRAGVSEHVNLSFAY